MNALRTPRLVAATLALILTAAAPATVNADPLSVSFGATTVNGHRHCHWEWHHHHRVQVCRWY
jgi:hypothetical protein